jgi:hypothetical protein
VGARSFRISPADDDEFLAIETFRFAAEATVSRRIGRINRLGNDALKPKLARVLADMRRSKAKFELRPFPRAMIRLCSECFELSLSNATNVGLAGLPQPPERNPNLIREWPASSGFEIGVPRGDQII